MVDDIEQACHSGEINIPISNGTLKRDHIYSTLRNIVAKFKKGRENDEEITIFDSTGLAIPDVVCAKIVYEKAKLREIPTFKFFLRLYIDKLIDNLADSLGEVKLAFFKRRLLRMLKGEVGIGTHKY